MRLLAVLAATLALGACADSGADVDPPPAVEGSSTSPPAPAYVETSTCRDDMRPLVDIATTLFVDDLALTTFESKVRQMDRRLDAAVAACSRAVELPARRAMYAFALARARWLACERGPCTERVGREIARGVRSMERAGERLDRTA